jgi:biotin carboxyl carrier protein
VKRRFEIADQSHRAEVARTSAGLEMVFEQSRHRLSLSSLGEGEHRIRVDGAAERVWLARRGDSTYVHLRGRSWVVRSAGEEGAAVAGEGLSANTAEAPMPGTVVRVSARPGDRVRRGQVLVVIESMKMETSVAAWRDGVVARIHHGVGATFDRRAPLVSLEPEETK